MLRNYRTNWIRAIRPCGSPGGGRLALATSLIAVVCASCSSLPSTGPRPNEIYFASARADDNPFSYELLSIDGRVINVLNAHQSLGLGSRFGRRQPAPQQRVGIGDTVVVTLFEASAGGLFSGSSNPSGGGAPQPLTLPPQTVDRDGTISVPYAGRIRVAGLTPAAISQAIVTALGTKANEPQAIVTITNTTSQSATVAGDLTTGGRIALNLKGDRLLEVIAQAGGVRGLPHETFISLTRGEQTGTVRLTSVLENSKDNVFVYPGDTIYVFREPQTFTSLGAVTQQGDLPIDRANMTLADAVGKSGGLSDIQADSSAVFVFRWERPEVVRALMPKSALLDGPRPVPVVYQLSFKDPKGYFYARSFTVNNKDIIYTANAPSVEFVKFLGVVRAVASTARSIQAADVNIPPQ